MVPYDEPPTDPRGVVKNDVEFAVSSSLSENRLRKKIGMKNIEWAHQMIRFKFEVFLVYFELKSIEVGKKRREECISKRLIYCTHRELSFEGVPNSVFFIFSVVFEARRLLRGLIGRSIGGN